MGTTRMPPARTVRKIQTARKDLRNLRGFYVVAAVIALFQSVPSAIHLVHGLTTAGAGFHLCAAVGTSYTPLFLVTAALIHRAPVVWAVCVASYFTLVYATIVVLNPGLALDALPIAILILLWGYVPMARRVGRTMREHGLSVARAAARASAG